MKEGDEDRIILACKIVILVFKAMNHTKYLKEAVNLVLQMTIFFHKERSLAVV